MIQERRGQGYFDMAEAERRKRGEHSTLIEQGLREQKNKIAKEGKDRQKTRKAGPHSVWVAGVWWGPTHIFLPLLLAFLSLFFSSCISDLSLSFHDQTGRKKERNFTFCILRPHFGSDACTLADAPLYPVLAFLSRWSSHLSRFF